MSKILVQIDKEYEGIKYCDDNGKIIVSYSDLNALDKFILYLIENVNGPLLTLLTGLISSLSINLLTNFIEIDLRNGICLSILALIKLLSCLVFNISLVYFTLVILNASNSIVISREVLPVQKPQRKHKELLNYYFERKVRLRCSFVSCVVFGIITIILIIATPFVSFAIQNQMVSAVS